MATTAATLIEAEECLAGSVDGKIGICHSTGLPSNPYVYIRVNTNGCVNGHIEHPGDFFPDDGSCPVCGNGTLEFGEMFPRSSASRSTGSGARATLPSSRT